MYLDRKPISREAAESLLAALPLTPEVVTVPVSTGLLGFVLAEDVAAPFALPSFRRSGYDGYGILAADDHDFPKNFAIADNIGAGRVFDQVLQPGQALRIMTGAQVPDEVGKVIMLEETEKTAEDQVLIRQSMKSSNISEIGEELAQGTPVLSAGQPINPGAISILNSFGYTEVAVYRKPRVGILANGSELLQPGRPLEPGKIYNSNGPLLAALAKANGAEVVACEAAPDDYEAIWTRVTELAARCDLVLTTGGVSVGDFDFIAVAAKKSQQFLFNKLAMRPGSPTTAFVAGKTPVIALSGNPSACFTGFYFFVEPLIQRFQQQRSRLTAGKATLASAYSKKNEFDRYLQGYLDATGAVTLTGHGQSSELTSFYQSNCFFKIPHDTTVAQGQSVEVWKIPQSR